MVLVIDPSDRPGTHGGPSTLSESERNEILYAWNQTQEEFPDLCVHELFERQVERVPDAVAVVFEGRRLTYRELNQRANQVAHFLRKHGVGPESLVGVSLKRCPELVVGLLGVWKAGGAYVPLDPAYPPERLAFMASDAGIRMLLTEASCKSLFPSAGVKAICLDSDWATLEHEPTTNPSPGAVPLNLAYVMYTSGSTGQPKGAMILHRGLVNYLCWAIKAYGVEAGGSVPVHSSISFDLTVTSLYPILLAGGHAELLPEDVGAQKLLSALRRQGGRTLVKITPAHLDLLSQQLKAEETGGVTKTFVIGGENLLAESVQPWRDFAPNTRLINEYGPTETVVGCCVHEVKSSDPESGSIPIGRPIANTQLYILDADMEPVPVGAMGELYIGGAGVARGYLNRPELTQERFLVDRFSGKEGARLYKTGDLARYRRDGTLEYLGRADNQVKIRGYRIELGEIEEALAGHPAVQACVVLAREDSPGNRQLVGYVVLRQGKTEAVEALSNFLKQRLPEYMVPAQLILLDSFPLTQNGKVDRKALPAPSEVSVVAGGPIAAPRNDTEKALVAIWAKLLNVGTVGIHDDFFELGGHSLLVIKAMSRIRDDLQVDLPPQSLFENSTVAGLAAVVMEAKGIAGELPAQEIRRIEPRKQPGPWPASFSQEQFWLLDQMVPGSPAYNVVDVIDLHGGHNASALKSAFGELVSRHEVLRTSFTLCDGQLMQSVSSASDLNLPEVDLGAFPESNRGKEWARVVREEGRRPFDLSQPSLLRATVVHLSGHEHKVLLTIHHIVADEWSLGLIHDEVTRLYAAFSQRRPSPLLPLPVQYADFACWQKECFREERLEEQIGYWKKALEGASAALTLPMDKPRSATQTLRGATEHFVLPKAVLDKLRALGIREQATLFMVLEAAFASLLYRYSGQSDILVGTPISGRTQSETQRMVGCFLNTVVLRSQFDDTQTFRTLLQRTREKALGAFAHAELPFGRLVTALASDRDLSRTPLFQVMFVLFDPDGVSRFTNLSAHRELETGTSKVDLTLSLSITEDGLGGEIEYSTDLFEADTIRRMGQHFGACLEEIARDADQSVSSLPILAESERRQLLVEWNATKASYPREVPLAQLVEAQVERTPDVVAVVCGEKSLSFAELNAQANQLARALVAQGAGPDRVVGLYVERSVEMVVALLAVVKAGAAYLPVDPLLPEERIGYMLEDSGASLVVTEKSLRTMLPAFSGPAILLDDESWKSNPRENLAVAVQPDHLAYVIYTSGSTGKPKGVEVARGALTNLLWSMREWLGLTAEDRLLAVTTISFDIAGTDMWLPLLVGARMVVTSREDAVDGASLRDHINRYDITFLQATPITWRLLLEAGWKGKSDIQIVCTGEAMPRDLAIVLQPMVRRLWNLYGPTETTIWSTGYQVRDGNQPILIGRPLANTQCYILDKDRHPVPIGVVGELYIAGDGLARGYHARPELTAEKFLRDPFGRQVGARMYRTGDLARYQADGNIECLGRTDHQVKIRGYRIELGEIEAALARHAAVRQAVVVDHEDGSADKRLVAYLVAEAPSIDLVEQLRGLLHSALPDYMVPSRFVALNAIPLTPSGKVDRKALPAPSEENVVGDGDVVGPRNPTEEALVALWSELLHVSKVGIYDNFFELGGHSLLAIKAMSRMREFFQAELPLRKLFESPTVAQLAAAVTEAKGSGEEVRRIELRKHSGPCPLSFAQEQFWLLDQVVPGSPAYNIVDVLSLSGEYHASALQRALDEMVRRHEILRTSFALGDQQLMQTALPASGLQLAEIDLSVLPMEGRTQEWIRIAREEAQKIFDLSKPPLLRATAVHHSKNEHRVLLTIHHIVADEWGMGLIQDELQQLYAAFSQDRPSPLAELPIQYADFACWQREWFGEERLGEQIGYWKKELEGASPALTLPTDKPRPAVQTQRGSTEQFALPKALQEQLRTLAVKEQVTPFMLLEAAFAVLLHRYSGQADILVGTPISARTQAETQRLIGCFLNTVVLRSQFGAGETFRTLLQQMRTRALGAFAHAELPFGRLVATMAPDRDASRTPLFQVMFVLLDPEGTSPASKTVGRRGLDTETSKFDLTLYLAMTEDGLTGTLEYSTELFETETIRRMGRHFGVLVEELARDAARSISSLPILAESERRQLLAEWNATEVSYPRDVPLAQLVEAQVERTPDVVAVVCGEKSLSFAELNAQANQLARTLVAQGAGPDRVVGLYVERSVEMVVALLAVVKAGAAYLPVDPLLPEERISYMLEDSGALLVVTERRLRTTLPAFSGSVILVDDESWQSNPRENLAVAVQPDHLAYVIYTSGSTGKPKGVEVPRGALTNFLWSMRDWLGLTAEDRLLAVTTISFDIAGLEIWLPLLVGARMVVASHDEAVDGAILREQIERHSITFLQATPITWRLLLEAGWKGRPDLQVVCGGEAMPRDLAIALQPIVRRLWNLYGPTETTIWSTGYLVRDGNQPILIGRPLANTQCYILDKDRHPVPIGVVGELYIAGDGLARGYHARPELTAEKFLRDPFSPQPGARMYRTGDLARYLADGNIECLGRTDHQVKIRGYRIELGEIESVLSKHQTIQEAVIVAREAQPGDVRLVAYVKPSGDSISESELRAHLRRSVPDYMVPQHFVVVEAFPITPSGKIDRKALPAPQKDDNAVSVAETYVEPRSELERRLTEVWRHVLGIEHLGIRDSFFDMGGHSMLAVKLLGQISRVFGKRMPLAVLLEAPTVEQLAKHLEDTENNDGAHSLVPLQATGTKPPLYWIPGGAALGLFTFSHHFIERLGPDQPVYGLATAFPKSAIDIEAVEQRAASYLKLIRRTQPHGPYHLSGICAGGTIAFELAQQLLGQGEEVGLLNMIDCWCPAWGSLNALWFKAQRLQYHLRVAREKHQRISAYGLERFAMWRAARAEREDVAKSVQKATRDGFVDSETQDFRVITHATVDVIAQYRVKFYPGQITLCISEDPPFYGITRNVDPRLAWIRHALGHDVHMVTGDHDTVIKVPHVFGLADVLRNSLQSASNRRSV